MLRFLIISMGLLLLCGSATAGDEAAMQRNWPAWRGPLANGVAPEANPPTVWSETNNVRWKVELPGKGHSGPIVFGDRVFITAAVPVGEKLPPVFDDAPGVHDSVPVTQRHQFTVMAFDRANGKMVWTKVAKEEFPHEGGHYAGSLASNSPVTDGELLIVSFGSRGLYCYDLKGNLMWHKDLGRMHTLHSHGEGSSPVIYKDWVILCWDNEGDSFLYAFDKRTGKERWKTRRDEKTSWATPLIVEVEGKPQILTSATRRVRGNDFETGADIWEASGLAQNAVASPVAYQGVAIFGNSYDFQAMLAVKLSGAKGNVTNTKQVLWKLNRSTPYVPSPLLYGDTLYFLRHNQNVLARLDPLTGEFRDSAIRLEGIGDFIFASPVGGGGRIYVTGRDGVTVVLKHDRKNEALAVNKLEDSFSASAAVAGRELFLRGERFLYCLAEPNKQ
ncbi:MAG: outer rane biosis protein BamB [Verrucomicrobiales bacterium]|nr:outer rane biosis protein BamB [Verrucomicrobiales bacterium]